MFLHWWGFGAFSAEAGIWFFASMAVLVVCLVYAFSSMCYYANRENFKAVGVFVVLLFAALYLFGVFNVLEYVIDHWKYVCGGLAVYLIGSYPYTRFIEWKRHKLPKLYDQREKRERMETESVIAHFKSEKEKAWTEQKRTEFYESRKGADPVFDEDSPNFDKRLAERRWAQHWNSVHLRSECDGYLDTLDPMPVVEEYLNEHGYREPIKAGDHKGWICGYMFWWPLALAYRIMVRWVLEFFSRVWDLIHWLYTKVAHTFQADSVREFERRKAQKQAAEKS